MEMFYALQNLSADTPNYRAFAPLFRLRSQAPFFKSGLWRPFLPSGFENFSSTNWTLAHILFPNSGAFSSSELSGTFICSLNWYLFCLLDSGAFSVCGLWRLSFLHNLVCLFCFRTLTPFLPPNSGAFSASKLWRLFCLLTMAPFLPTNSGAFFLPPISSTFSSSGLWDLFFRRKLVSFLSLDSGAFSSSVS